MDRYGKLDQLTLGKTTARDFRNFMMSKTIRL